LNEDLSLSGWKENIKRPPSSKNKVPSFRGKKKGGERTVGERKQVKGAGYPDQALVWKIGDKKRETK